MKTNPASWCPRSTLKTFSIRRWKLKLLAGFFILGLAPAAQAAVVTVDTIVQCGGGVAPEPVDCCNYPVASGDGIAGCSFGEAICATINKADFGACVGVGAYGPSNTIVLPGGAFNFTQVDNSEVGTDDNGDCTSNGPNALPVIKAGTVSVQGNSSNLLRGGDAFMRLAQVDTSFARLSLNDVSVEGFFPGCDRPGPFCGDGINQACQTGIDFCEECDDGNTDDRDGCDSNCRFTACGDNITNLDAGEQCDDGGTCSTTGARCSIFDTNPCGTSGGVCIQSDNDGCNSDCHNEVGPDFDTCGNGVLDPGEVCDGRAVCVDFNGIPSEVECDSNLDCTLQQVFQYCQSQSADGDNCDSTCQNLEGCGNGVVEEGETCDNGGVCVNAGPDFDGRNCDEIGDCCVGASCGRLTACVPQNDDGCNDQCQVETCNNCHCGGAILVGDISFIQGGSGGGEPPVFSGLELEESVLKANLVETSPPPGFDDSAFGGAVCAGGNSEVIATHTEFVDNVASFGGAVFLSPLSHFHADHTTFSGNVAELLGTEDIDSPFQSLGGAVVSFFGDVQIDQSAFFENAADAWGGGLAFLCSDGVIQNTSFFDNAAGLGGGLYSLWDQILCLELAQQTFCDEDDNGDPDCSDEFSLILEILGVLDPNDVQIKSSTITTNRAVVNTASGDMGEGGGVWVSGGDVTLRNTILAGNTSDVGGPDCNGPLVSDDYNILGNDGGCGFMSTTHDLTNVDPLLDACLLVAGPGNPHCPLTPASPANDTASLDCPADDQIGTDRYGPDGACDRGAIELNNQTCGNGVKELPGESCDDGGHCNGDPFASECTTLNANLICGAAVPCLPVSGDGCDQFCVLESCGNGVVDAGEQCDDGKTCSDAFDQPTTTTCTADADCVAVGSGDSGSCAFHNGDGCSNVCNNEFCGDGITQPTLGELCDDGNLLDTDSCKPDCTGPVCGDGIVNGNEDCDDGLQCPPGDTCNSDGNCVDTGGPCVPLPGDGCDEDCRDEDGGGGSGLCGDNIQQPGEECDDGGLVAGDGCSPTCRDEGCGDGFLDPDGGDNAAGGGDDEECDDNNTITGDGCTSFCQTEECGDGILSTLIGEQCDDGGTTPGDGCDDECQVEIPPSCGDGVEDTDGADNIPGTVDDEQCDDGNTILTDDCLFCRDEYCGDGFTDMQGPSLEQCDDGNSNDLDLCRNDCTAPVCGNDDTTVSIGAGEECELAVPASIPPGMVCSAFCELEPEDGGGGSGVCGDNIQQPGEECDDGGLVAGDGCSPTCRDEGCGDGFLDANGGDNAPGGGDDEECDDNNSNTGDGCTSFCQTEECGDGILSFLIGEQCDDGGTTPGDGCDDECLVEEEPGPVCGNSTTEPGEECDDGNTNTNDDCVYCRLAQCGDDFIHTLDSGLTGDDPLEGCDDGAQSSGDGCDVNCQPEIPPLCGNGAVDSGEDCDDGNDTNIDNCKNDCTDNVCGDGFIELGVEQCDDGGTVSGDGCSSACVLESCGDGIQQSGESCDDGNRNALDGCSGLCQVEECSDGIAQAALGEECDDGNDINEDECSNDCLRPRCGDEIVQSGEQCDDGDTNAHDFCKNDCSLNICGDGVVEFGEDGEECDDGNGVDNDSCSDDCEEASCPDGIVQIAAGEECEPDIASSIPVGMICSNFCELEPGGGETQPFCGDGAVDGLEECDDANSINTDVCTNNCRDAICGDGIVQEGVDECDGTFGCLEGCIQNVCGDGVVLTGVETCDDGNTDPGDGCDEECLEEEPTEPAAGECGNGKVEEGEQCDNGLSNSDEPNRSCRENCTNQSCGDGIEDDALGEECEPGLDDPNCSSECKVDDCIAIKEDAARIGSPGFGLTEYLKKYEIDPFSGCSPSAEVNACQPLAAIGGAGSEVIDIPESRCLTTTSAQSGCSLIR